MNVVPEQKKISGGRVSWDNVFQGKLWVLQQETQSNGMVYERAFRTPGVRLLFVREGKVLLSQEARKELGGKVDHRLPGGKVFDSVDEYQDFLASGRDILEASRKSACKEALEEVGIVIKPTNLRHLATDILGAICSWDLHYWVCDEFEFHSDGAQYHEAEVDDIKGFVWVPILEACRMSINKDQFSESRSAAVIIDYAVRNGYLTIR